MNWPLFQNSLFVSALATASSVAMGFLAALWLAGLEARWRKGVLALAIVGFALPPFLVTSCWLHLFGHNGICRGWLPLNIYSPGGTVLILVLLTWPITTLTTLGAWRQLEPAQLEGDPALRGAALLRWLLVPLARPALAQAAVLTFALALNNFAVPAILQVKVFPAELWVSFNTTFDYAAALRLSWPLVAAPLLLLLWLSRREIGWPRGEGAVPAPVFRRQLGRSWWRCAGTVAVLIAVLSAGLPLVELAGAARTWTELPKAAAAGVGAVWNSFWLAAVTATVCVTLGLLIWRWPAGWLLWLPFLVPGVVLAIALIAALNRPPFIAFYQSFGMVILALTLRYLALGWSGATLAMRSVDRDLVDVARLNGASGWQLFRHAHWPQIAPRVAAAWYVVYLLCLWDVESLVFYVPPGGETLALRIFNLLHYGHNPQVNALCLLLLGLAVAPLFLVAVFVRTRQFISGRIRINFSRAVTIAATGALPACVGTALLAGCSPEAVRKEAPVQSRFFSRVQVIGSRGTGPGQFNKPRSVAVDRADNLYVVDMTGRVQKFSPTGQFLLAWQMPQTDKGKPKGMDCDNAGNMVVVEPHYSRVNYFAADGKLISQWGENGTNAGQLAFPRAVAVNSRGEIYVSEYGPVERVQRFAPDGRGLLGAFGQPGEGAGEFNRAEGLGVDGADRVYVADSCNHRIQIFSREGTFLRAHGRAGEGRGEFSYPYDVRVDAAGLQFVCEYGNSRVQIIDAADQPLEILGGPGAAPGQFSNPWSLALDSRGNLYVADAGNHRVQKFVRKKVISVRCPVISVEQLATCAPRPLNTDY